MPQNLKLWQFLYSLLVWQKMEESAKYNLKIGLGVIMSCLHVMACLLQPNMLDPADIERYMNIKLLGNKSHFSLWNHLTKCLMLLFLLLKNLKEPSFYKALHLKLFLIVGLCLMQTTLNCAHTSWKFWSKDHMLLYLLPIHAILCYSAACFVDYMVLCILYTQRELNFDRCSVCYIWLPTGMGRRYHFTKISSSVRSEGGWPFCEN